MTDRFRMLPSYHYEDNTDGNLLKSVGKPLRDYKIEGNCFQDNIPSPDNPVDIQCCGEKTVNLLPYPYNQSYATNNGIAFTYGDDGSICMNGTCTAAFSTYLFIDKEKLIPGVKIGDTIMLSKNANDEAQAKTVWMVCNYYDSSGTMKQGIVNSKQLTASGTISEEWVGIGCYIHVPVDTTLNNLIFKPQIELGNAATEFEPYGYKVPVTVDGENLIDFAGYFNQTLPYTRYWGWGATAIYGDDGTITLNCASVSTSHDANDIYFFDSSYMEPGTYTISGVPYVLDENGNRVCNLFGHYYENGVHISKYLNNIDTGKEDVTFTIEENQGVSFSLRVSRAFTADNMIFKPLLKKLEPYKEPKTYNIYLDEPLRRVGDYADYVDFKNGKVVRNVITMNLYELDDRYVIKNYTYGNNFDNTYHFNCYLVSTLNLEDICVAKTDMYCNILPAGNLGMNYLETDSFFTSMYTAARYPWYAQIEKALIDSYSGDTIVDKFKAFLTDKKAELYYCRQNYGETPISLPQILTEKHTNIISVGTTLQPSKVNYQYYKGGK